MSDKAHAQTDEILAKMERHINSIYKRASDEIGVKWQEYLTKSNKKIDELQKEFDKTGDKAIKEKLQQAKKSYTIVNKRFKDLSTQTAEQLLHVNEIAVKYVNGELPNIYALNYNSFPDSEIDGYSFTLTDADTIKNLATSDETLLPYKEVNGVKDIRWNTQKINSEVLQGILQGESMQDIAKRLQNVEDMNRHSAIRNARTSVTSAENKGRIDSFKQAEKDGIILQKKWVSTEDKRTRHWHSDLDGKTAKVDEPFYNDFGAIMYPADVHAHPANVYNCRCTLVSEILGFNKLKMEQKQEINIDNRKNAYDVLQNQLGFINVEQNVDLINEELLIENTKRLVDLENKFGVLKKSNLYFTSTNSGDAIAYVSSKYTEPTAGGLSLCSSRYSQSKLDFVKREKKLVDTNWSMPCDEKYLSVTSVTHEYGHILQNILIQERFEKDGWTSENKRSFVDVTKKTKNAQLKWYMKREKEVQLEDFKEIVDIAKEKNSNFSLKDNISNYGKTNYSEFFAEVFANSQCGKPNELGKAMNIWLERKGLIK